MATHDVSRSPRPRPTPTAYGESWYSGFLETAKGSDSAGSPCSCPRLDFLRRLSTAVRSFSTDGSGFVNVFLLGTECGCSMSAPVRAPSPLELHGSDTEQSG